MMAQRTVKRTFQDGKGGIENGFTGNQRDSHLDIVREGQKLP